MDLTQPHAGVVPGLHGRVLMVLARAVGPLTGREIARRCEGSQQGAARVLGRLVEHGLAQRTDVPPAALYELNRQHVAAPAVEQLARLRLVLLERLARSIDGWRMKPTNVTLFGSSARGEGSVGSDIDLLVVRPDDVSAEDPVWAEQVVSLQKLAQTWTGNPGRAIEYGLSELRDAARSRLPLLHALLTEGVTVSGTSVRELTLRERMT